MTLKINLFKINVVEKTKGRLLNNFHHDVLFDLKLGDFT